MFVKVENRSLAMSICNRRSSAMALSRSDSNTLSAEPPGWREYQENVPDVSSGTNAAMPILFECASRQRCFEAGRERRDGNQRLIVSCHTNTIRVGVWLANPFTQRTLRANCVVAGRAASTNPPARRMPRERRCTPCGPSAASLPTAPRSCQHERCRCNRTRSRAGFRSGGISSRQPVPPAGRRWRCCTRCRTRSGLTVHAPSSIVVCRPGSNVPAVPTRRE